MKHAAFPYTDTCQASSTSSVAPDSISVVPPARNEARKEARKIVCLLPVSRTLGSPAATCLPARHRTSNASEGRIA